MKKISLLMPCYNEEENIDELYGRLNEVSKLIQKFSIEILFIDNASEDSTVKKLKAIAKTDSRVKIIVNNRNYGTVRSPYWGMMQAQGDAVIVLASDLQDPPELIPEFLAQWELGWKVVFAVKPTSETSFLFHQLRRFYYNVLNSISNIELIRDATGFGLYDRDVLDQIKKISDPYPYIRGLVSELGYPVKKIVFQQPKRRRGISKNNFYSLFDMAMLGMVSHSLVPIRIASFCGLLFGLLGILVAAYYSVMKFLYWDTFPIGIAPLIVGFFLAFGMLFIFIGMLGEYIGSIHTYVRKWPIVVESERVNF
jgi:glycosyltransferase involved in cell wall biosynthesis